MSEELAGAIAKRQADPEPDPGATVTAFGLPDQAQVLRVLGLDPRDPRAHAVVQVARRYNLDPILNHVMILPKTGRPYITLDGYRHIAHSSGVYDGMTVTDGPRRDGAEREWTARVAVYRRDMSRPFEFPGRAALTAENGPEMALARAKRRSLREAFDVSVPREFADDEWDDRPLPPAYATAEGEAPPAAAEADPGAAIDPKQRTAIQAGFKELGMTRTARLQALSDWTNRKVTSANDLTYAEAADVLDRLTAIRRDRADLGEQADAEERAAAEHLPPDADGETGSDAEQQGPPAPPPDASGGEADAEFWRDPPPPGDEPADRRATTVRRNTLIDLLRASGITERPDVLSLVSAWCNRKITNTAQLSAAECEVCIVNAKALTTITTPDG
jgi:hypothetical protein